MKAICVWVFALIMTVMFFAGVGEVCERMPWVAEVALDAIAIAMFLSLAGDRK